MVSVQNLDEAMHALKGGADIVDVKNLQEALVGSANPWVVEQIRDAIPKPHHASVTLGVVPNQIGTVAMAVYAAGRMGATSVKVGFMNTEYDHAAETLLASKQALEGTDTKLIGSLFADNPLYDGLEADHMVRLAKEGECDGWLIDTLTKDGRNLFDFMSESELRDMVFDSKQDGMSTALSGHLKIDNLDELSRINPDIVGVRGAVCAQGERSEGVYWEAVAEFKRQLDMRQSGEIDVLDGAYMANGSKNGDGKRRMGRRRRHRQDLRQHPRRAHRARRGRLPLLRRSHHAQRPQHLRRRSLGRRTRPHHPHPAQRHRRLHAHPHPAVRPTTGRMIRQLTVDQPVLDLATTLHMGQDFRWRKRDDGWHSGVLSGNLILMRRTERGVEYKSDSDCDLNLNDC